MKIVSHIPGFSPVKSRLEELADRLEHGDAMIRALEAENKPTGQLERHWLKLLHEYEQAFQNQQEAA